MASRPFIDIPLAPYLPDFGGLPNPAAPGYLVDALGVRPTPSGYRGMPTLVNVTSASVIASSFTSGLGTCLYTTSTKNFFLVNSSGIVESRAEGTDTWTDVSPATGTVNGFGDFVQFDNDAIYVCSSRAPVSKTLTATHATLFANLAGSPPTGGCAARIGQHVVIGQLSTDYYAVQTSAIGTHTDWPTPGTADARSKQSIQESLNEEFGFVSRVLPGEKFGIIMQDKALTRMTYVGGSAVYAFDTYYKNNGAGFTAAQRPCTDGSLWYWFNETGIFATDGYSVKQISYGKVEESLFLNTLSYPHGAVEVTPAFGSVYDARRRIVIFGNNNGGATDYQIVYHVDSEQFSLMVEANRSTFFSGWRSSGVTNINGRNVYGVNSSSRLLQRLDTGGSPTIAVQTGYIELDPGYRFQLQGAHILGTGTGSLTLAYKTAATSAACDMAQTGFTSLTAAGLGEKKTGRASAQYIAFRITGTGAESQLIRGIRVYFQRAEEAP